MVCCAHGMDLLAKGLGNWGPCAELISRNAKVTKFLKTTRRHMVSTSGKPSLASSPRTRRASQLTSLRPWFFSRYDCFVVCSFCSCKVCSELVSVLPSVSLIVGMLRAELAFLLHDVLPNPYQRKRVVTVASCPERMSQNPACLPVFVHLVTWCRSCRCRVVSSVAPTWSSALRLHRHELSVTRGGRF